MIKKDKLALRKSALRVLNDSELTHVVGGNGTTGTTATLTATFACPAPPTSPPQPPQPPQPTQDCTQGCPVTTYCPSNACGGGGTGGSGSGSGIGSDSCFPIEEE